MRTHDQAKRIAQMVVLAQDASDAGKGKNQLDETKMSRRYSATGYDAKLHYILSAIKLINSSRPCGWNYYVIKSPDQNGYPSYITYFQYKDSGNTRYELSFHTPWDIGYELYPFLGKGRKTHWNGKRCGSLADANALVALFDL